MNLENILSNILSIVVGGFITWGVSYLYYIRSSKKLVEELESLRKWNRSLARFLDEHFPSEESFHYDSKGNPDGRIKVLKATAHGNSLAKAHTEVMKQNNVPEKTND